MKKRDKIIFGISLICMVLVVLVGLTYAYWLSIKKQTSRNLIATSCLDLTMADESVEIKRENSYPMSDEKGLSTTPYTFKLINNCNIKTKVSFVLDIDKTEDFSLDMFKAAMNNHEIEWEPEKLSKLDTELNPDTIQYHKIVVTDTIEAQETKEYELRLWIDKDVTINDVVARFTSKLRITMEPYRQCGMTITDPNPGEFRGTGTEDDPYLIESIEDLVALSLNTKAGILEPYKYYKLTTDLDFECESSYADWQSTNYGDINGNEVAQDLKSELTTGNGFYPIGIYSKDKEFRSNFNGGYHTINNLYSKNSNTGLFGYVKTEDTVITIKNVDIGIKDLQGTYIGGVVAEGHSNIKSGIVIKNIRADGELNPKGYVSKVAGVCGYGYSVKIENCINKVSIKTDNYSYAGGIAGELYGSFELNNLTNYGSIEANY